MIPVPTPPTPVSIIIPCRNEREHIRGCLEDVFAQEAPGLVLEVIVADGMSDDGTRAILETLCARYPALCIVDNPAKIASAGLNAAIRQARGTIIVRMDAHTLYAPDYVRSCVEVLRETGADNVGGAARTRATTYMQRAIAAGYHSPFSVGGARFHDETYEGYLDTVTYGCWPRAGFERFGYFDETLVRNQDDEHNLRISRAGGRIWQSARIKSWYSPRGSLSALFRQYYQYGYWKVRVIRKHRLPASPRHVVPALFVAGLLVCLAGAPFLWPFRWAGALAAGCYGVALLAASFRTAALAGWRMLPVLPVVFAMFHFGYGIGFLHGALDGLILKRGPWAGATTLTRNRPATEGKCR
jgi:GT2 family glycosyltransferase